MENEKLRVALGRGSLSGNSEMADEAAGWGLIKALSGSSSLAAGVDAK